MEEAQNQTVLFKIKVPPQSVLPAGYHLVAAAVMPVGPVFTETYTRRTFRPQEVTLYYWNQTFDSKMLVSQFKESGGIFVDEMYSLGINSTDPYLVGVNQVPSYVTVGWFKGYPGFWYNGYAEVFQFDKNMSYSVKGQPLTKEQALAVIETLLADREDPAPSSAATTITTTYIITTSITRTQTTTSTQTRTSAITVSNTLTTTTVATTYITTTSIDKTPDPSTYAWAVSATVAAVVLAAVLMLQRRRK